MGLVEFPRPLINRNEVQIHMKKLTRLTFLMLLLLTLKTNVSLGKNTSQIIMPINDDLPYIDVYNMDNSIASPKYSS